MFNTKSLAVCGMLALCATSATAGSWSLDPSVSNISFGSIKNDYIGESHSFGDISGSVNHDGVVKINVGLGSVQTNIDIRDERMVEHVFASAPDATITAAIDMSAMEKLEVGSSRTMETTGQLAFLGQEMELDAKLFVMRPFRRQSDGHHGWDGHVEH